LTLANALVTLDGTMWGIAARHLLKHFKTGMVLLAITIALSLAGLTSPTCGSPSSWRAAAAWC
jgi:hypothetical protein